MFRDVQMNNGAVFEGEKIEELTKYIVNKFSQEQLSHDEAIEVLRATKNIIGEYSMVQNID